MKIEELFEKLAQPLKEREPEKFVLHPNSITDKHRDGEFVGFIGGEPVFNGSEHFRKLLQKKRCLHNGCEGHLLKRSDGRWVCDLPCGFVLCQELIDRYDLSEVYD